MNEAPSKEYRLVTARLLVSSFGDKIKHTQTLPLNLLATSLPGYKSIQEKLDKCRREYKSAPFTSARLAMRHAVKFVDSTLNMLTASDQPSHDGGIVVIDPGEPAYQEIVDENGKVVGHDTVVVITSGGQEVMIPENQDPWIGGFGVVMLAIEEIM